MNPEAGLSVRQPQPIARVNILRSTSPTRLARIGVGFAPCSLRARLLGFSFEGRALPFAMMFSSFATSCGVISVTSFLPQCGATSLVSIECWSEALVLAKWGTCSAR